MSKIIVEMIVMFSKEGKVYFNPDNSRFSMFQLVVEFRGNISVRKLVEGTQASCF